MQHAEDKVEALGAQAVTERGYVYVVPSKTEDPRVLGIHTSVLVDAEEVAMCSLL